MPRRMKIKVLGLGNVLEETQRATGGAKKTLKVVERVATSPRMKKIMRGSKN
jgi:hypothetical protein